MCALPPTPEKGSPTSAGFVPLKCRVMKSTKALWWFPLSLPFLPSIFSESNTMHPTNTIRKLQMLGSSSLVDLKHIYFGYRSYKCLVHVSISSGKKPATNASQMVSNFCFVNICKCEKQAKAPVSLIMRHPQNECKTGACSPSFIVNPAEILSNSNTRNTSTPGGRDRKSRGTQNRSARLQHFFRKRA